MNNYTGKPKQLRLFPHGLVCALTFLSALTALAVPPPGGVAPVVAPVGGIRIDGDLMADLLGGDWLGGTNAASGVLNAAGVPLDPARTFHFIDPFTSTADIIFGGGLKWTDNPNLWTWTTGKASSKTDINNVLLHIADDAEGHTWTIVAADRASTSGESYIDFEFLQSPLIKTNTGKFVSAGPNGGRTVNDLVLSLAFVNGGSVADFLAYRWLPDGNGGYAYVDVTASLPVGRVFVALNSNNIAVPYGAFGSTSYAANAFAEAALDLTALLGGFDPCLSVGFKTIMVKTKTSSSSSAGISDFIDPIQYSLHVGPSADAGPDQTRCTEGDSTAFPLQGHASAGLQPIVSTTWSVLSGVVVLDSPDSLVATAHVSSASATLRLTVIETNGCTETDDVVLTVGTYPICSIDGPGQLCANSTNLYQAPAGMTAYAWSISGNGSISGPTNAQTVKVISGAVCGSPFTLNLKTTSGICSTFCATDVLVADTTPPIMLIPSDKVLDCPANTTTNATGSATAQDDCGKVTVTYSDSVTNVCGGAKIIARTWTATDYCGNSTNAVQTITVRDITPPTLVMPTNRTLECPANTSPANTGTATSQDACGSVSVTFSDVVSNSCGGARLIARTWIATDACGNTTNGTQLITVRDTTRPTLILPANLTLECPADTSTNNTGSASSQDACGAVTVTYSDTISNSCGATYTIRRLWTAADDCGNFTNGTQTITVRDTKAPSLVIPVSLTLECPADTTTNNTGSAVAVDACSALTLVYTDVVTNNCLNTKVIARKWTATDACGNSTNAVQTITVRDTTPPSLIPPPNLTLECPAVTTTNNTGVALAQDGCGSVTLTFTDTVTNYCGGTKLILRNWRAVDSCGNITNAVQTIAVRDTTPPSLSLPANLTLECPAVTTTNATGAATSQDACGSVLVSYSDLVTTNCANTKVIARTWTATDSCGNTTNRVQTITVRDSLPPTLTVPANVTLECPAVTTTNNTGVATAQDGCGSVTISYNDVVTNNCGGTRVIARTWTATDACGNIASRVQTITVRDTLRPTLILPASVTLECPADTTTNNTGTASSQDGCGAVTVTYSDSTSNTCGATYVIRRLWTATDGCGNTTNGLQTITVRDTKAPSLVIPSNVTLECPADTTTNNTGSATASDACNALTLVYSDVVTTNCLNTKVIARKWTATDACGNSTNATQTITVRDTIPPSLIIPGDLTLECPAVTTTNNTGVAIAQDGCGLVTVTFTDTVTNLCGGTKVILRNWRAADSCGNTTNRIQTITVRDTIAPTLTVPTNVVLECPTINTGTNFTGTATAQDGCGSVAITYSDVVATNCGGTRVITRTWTATDQCGNLTTGIQTITIRDTIKPSLVVPANVTLECPANTTTNNTGTAVAQDGCGKVTLVYNDSVSNSCSGTKVISRLWTATDECGNATNKLQVITVVDTQRPTITAPPNVVIDCPASTAPSNTGTATAQDGCSSVTISYSDVATNFCGGTKTITRTWTATDSCGNTASAVQTITVRDITAPALKLPANIVLQCPGDTRTNVTGIATATDGCGSVTISYSDIVSNGCSFTKTVWRTWTAVDQCGNTTNGLQTISVVDNTKPTITLPNISVQCVSDIPPAHTNLAAFRAAGGTATDACSANLAFALISDSGLVGRCPGTVTRVYRAIDDCGNFADVTQRITVDDTIAPTITCPPSLTVEYGASIDPTQIGSATATDNCSTNVTITHSDSPVSSVYSVNFYSADPDLGTGPYSPTYPRLGPASLPCPSSAMLTGRALDPLRNAVAFGPSSSQLDALTSLGGAPMSLGQIVPFEAVITLDGAPGPERGTIEFSASWATHSTSNDRFGFDTNYMVYCAFVDAADPGCIDPNYNGRVQSISSTIINRGTIDEQIIGTFRVTGLDVGDQVVVEIWMVLNSVQPGNVGGTIAAQLVSAAKYLDPPEPISIGSKTISIGNLNKMEALPPPQQQPPLGPLPPQPPVPPGVIISVIDRTWAATDDCGNTRTCVQRITMRDTSPPVLILPPDVVLECPANTSTNNTGSAVASDLAGGSVLISYSDTVTNGCGASKVISRLWTATDTNGNGTNRVQTITVSDLTPPALSIPANVVLEYGANTSPSVTGSATAQDSCGSATVSYTDAGTVASNTVIMISRTWTAIDSCGNTTNGIQTITLQNAPLPVITLQPVGGSFGCGDFCGLTVAASGTGPLTYQWQLNGADIPGATGTTLNVSPLEYSNAGLYCVAVTGPGGTVMSQIAIVNIFPVLQYQASGNTMTLSWAGPFTLQAAPNVTGPYVDKPKLTSPCTFFMVGPQQFFRLRSAPIVLGMGTTNGTQLLTVTGPPGVTYIIQASTDLIHWFGLQTNTLPIICVDPIAAQVAPRFYRTIQAH